MATTTFPTPGSFDVAVEVTDNEGATDIELKTINVAAASNAPPVRRLRLRARQTPRRGQNVVFDSTSSDPDGSVAALDWDFDGDGQFDDGSGGKVTRSFPVNGLFPVALRATDDDGAHRHRNPLDPGRPAGAAGRYLHGQAATVVGGAGAEKLTGTPGDDVIAGFAGRDRIRGLGGDDVICGGRGGDRVLGGAGDDVLRGNKGPDRIGGGPGRDDCGGGKGRDRLRSCP